FWGTRILAFVLESVSSAASAPLTLSVSFDGWMLGYALVLTTFTGLAFGLAPALHATRSDVSAVLKQDDFDPAAGRAWMRGALIGGQVAVCMLLLVVAGLLLRGLRHTQTVAPGFAIDGVHMLTL